MRYESEKLRQVRLKAAERGFLMGPMLERILLEVFQSDAKIAEEYFTKGWHCGYDRGYDEGFAAGVDAALVNEQEEDLT